MKNNKSKKDKIRLGNQRDFGLLYDTLLSGGTYSDYRSELLDRSMPQERPLEITEDDILAAWILGKDDESELYARGGHLHQDLTSGIEMAKIGLDLYLNGAFDEKKHTSGFDNLGAYNQIVSGITDVVGNSVGAARDIDYGKYDSYLNLIGSYNPGFSTDTSFMMNEWNQMPLFANVSYEDAGGHSGELIATNVGKSMLSGATAGAALGSVVPVIGTAIGAVGGALFGGISQGIGEWRNSVNAKQNQDYINTIGDINAKLNPIKFGYTSTLANKLGILNQLSQPYMATCGGKMKNKLASGGYINSHYDYITDPLVKVEAGGTHQENPNEGVLTSIAPDGQPNLVEEDETIINNGQDDAYVFSDRIVADDEILKSHLLPNKFAGKTYADISKELDKIIAEHKNDEISKRTFDEMISRLQQAQEDQKFQEKQEEVEKFLDGLTDEQKEQLEETMVEEAQAEQQAAEEQAIAEQLAQELVAQEQLMQPEQAPMEQLEEQVVPSRYDQMMSRALFADAANLGMFGLGGHLHQGRNNSRLITAEELSQYTDPYYTNTVSEAASRNDGVFHVAPGYFNYIAPDNQLFDESNVFQVNQAGYDEYLRRNLPDQTSSNGATLNGWPIEMFALPNSDLRTETRPTNLRFSYNPETGRYYPVSESYMRSETTAKPLSSAKVFGDNLNRGFGRFSGAETQVVVLPGNERRVNNNRTQYIYNESTAISPELPGSKRQLRVSSSNTTGQHNDTSGTNRNNVSKKTNNSLINNLPSITPTGLPVDYGYTNPNDRIPTISQEMADVLGSEEKSIPEPTKKEIKEAGWRKRKDGTWYKKESDGTTTDYSTWLRYAPAIGSGIQYLSDLFGVTNRNDFSNADMYLKSINNIPSVGFTPLGNYMTYSPLDETYQQNVARSQYNAARRAAINNASGNAGAALAAMSNISGNMNNTFGDLALQSRQYNDKQREAVEQFNANIARINSMMSLSAQEKNQAIAAEKARLTYNLANMRENIQNMNDAAKSANENTFYNNLGAIGKENFNMQMVRTNPAFYYTIMSDGSIVYKNGFYDLNKGDQDFITADAEKAQKEQLKKNSEDALKKSDDMSSLISSPLIGRYFSRPGFWNGYQYTGGLTNNRR